MDRSNSNMPMLAFISKAKRRWVLPAIALLVAIAALATALLLHRWFADAMRSELKAQKTTRSMIDRAAQARAPACASEFAYAQSLPTSISLDKLVQSLQDSAKAFGVTMLSVSGEPRPANARALETLVVSIALHGGYAGIKSTLAESLSRFPTAALQEMNFKRAGAAQLAVEDVNVQIVFVLRPTASGSSECRMPPTDGAAEAIR
jgi:hypothetical protein